MTHCAIAEPIPPSTYSPIDLTVPYQCLVAPTGSAAVANTTIEIHYVSQNSVYDIYASAPFEYEMSATIEVSANLQRLLLIEGYSNIEGLLETEFTIDSDDTKPMLLSWQPSPLNVDESANISWSASGTVGPFQSFGGNGWGSELIPAPGSSLLLTLTAQGAEPAAHAAWSLSCERNDPPETKLSFSRSPLIFAPLVVGSHRRELITISNNTLRGFDVLSMSIVGTNQDQFNEQSFRSNGCYQYMGPGESCTFSVPYSPNAVGKHNATMILTTDAGEYYVGLIAEAIDYVAPSIQLSSSIVDLGYVEVGSSVTEVVTLTNTGPARIQVDLIYSYENSTNKVLNVRPLNCRSVAPGETCDFLQIRYSPAGPWRSELTAEIEAANNLYTSEEEPLITPLTVFGTGNPAAACADKTSTYDIDGELVITPNQISAPLIGTLTHHQRCAPNDSSIKLELDPTAFGVPLFSFLPDRFLTYTELAFTPTAAEFTLTPEKMGQAEFQIQAPRIYVDLFGLDINLSNNDECALKEPITIKLDGLPTDGKVYTDTLSLSPLQNCDYPATRVNAILESVAARYSLKLISR